MARGKRTSAKDKAKVVSEKLKNPDMSLRDLQKKTGVNYKVSGDIINEVPGLVTSCNVGKSIIEKLDNTIDNIQKIIDKNLVRMIDEDLKAKELKSLADIQKQNFDRKQILTGKPTEINYLSIDLDGKSSKELEELRKQIIG